MRQRKDYNYTPYKIKEGEIFLPPEHTNIILELSGGADSAALAWEVLSYLRRKNTILDKITFFTCNRLDMPTTEMPAIAIFKKIASRFPEQNCVHRIEDWTPVKGTNFLKLDFMEKIEREMFEEGHTAIFRAITTAPSEEVQKEIGMWDNKYRPIGREKDEEERFIELNPYANRYKMYRQYRAGTFEINGVTIYDSAPWYTYDKKFIASIYKKHTYLMEHIYNLTFSCVEMDPSITDFWDKPCKECWWCKEKYWAFGTYDYGIK